MTSQRKILIVDDDEPIRFVLERALIAEGYEVKTAGSGEQALEMASRERFDLIMIDLVMPGKDGFQTIPALRADHPGIGIIAMSGGWNGCPESFLRLAGRMGVNATLAKPFSKASLLEAIDSGTGKPGLLSA